VSFIRRRRPVRRVEGTASQRLELARRALAKATRNQQAKESDKK
jgi:hypothetical protein